MVLEPITPSKIVELGQRLPGRAIYSFAGAETATIVRAETSGEPGNYWSITATVISGQRRGLDVVIVVAEDLGTHWALLDQQATNDAARATYGEFGALTPSGEQFLADSGVPAVEYGERPENADHEDVKDTNGVPAEALTYLQNSARRRIDRSEFEGRVIVPPPSNEELHRSRARELESRILGALRELDRPLGKSDDRVMRERLKRILNGEHPRGGPVIPTWSTRRS